MGDGAERGRVLLVDDERNIVSAVSHSLRALGIEVSGHIDVESFMREARLVRHDALLIDWNLRTCEGTDVCSLLRADGDQRPIGLVSGKLEPAHGDSVARSAGADCYIEKPFDGEALHRAVTDLLQLGQSQAHIRTHRLVVRCVLPKNKAIGICLEGTGIVVTNVPLRLRPKELELLAVLLRNAGKVVAKEELARLAWGIRSVPNSTIVETTMSRLRTSLGPVGGIIQTVRGGYMIDTLGTDDASR